MFLSATLLLHSIFLGAALAQTRTNSATAATDSIVIQFKLLNSMSIRDQYINTSVFDILIHDRAAKLPHHGCDQKVYISDRFLSFDLAVRDPDANKRRDCLRGAVNYVLHEAISEADFLIARQAKVESAASWTNPHPRYSTLAIHASERLAYLAIYRKGSPLHELYSIAEADYSALSFDDFEKWIDHIRRDGSLTISGSAALLQLLGLDAVGEIGSISLVSPRSPPGVLFYDGERFGVAALIMVSISPDNANHRLRDAKAWDRFSCNRSNSSRANGVAVTGSISSVACFSHQIFATDSWLGLAIRKTDASGYADFCAEVSALANDADITELNGDGPEASEKPYVLLPPRCQDAK